MSDELDGQCLSRLCKRLSLKLHKMILRSAYDWNQLWICSIVQQAWYKPPFKARKELKAQVNAAGREPDLALDMEPRANWMLRACENVFTYLATFYGRSIGLQSLAIIRLMPGLHTLCSKMLGSAELFDRVSTVGCPVQLCAVRHRLWDSFVSLLIAFTPNLPVR